MVTILIPTINRPEYIIRMMRYYHSEGFRGTLLIGDSSDEANFAKVRDEAAVIGESLRVRHIPCRDANLPQTMERLANLVDTPYVAFIGDDDFLIPSAIDECEDFLAKNPDYSACTGIARGFRVKSDRAFGDMELLDEYPMRRVEEKTASDRLVSLLMQYHVIIFSVHRADVWREMWRDPESMPDRAFSCELLPCCMSVVLGKVKQIDCLYLLRESHSHHHLLPSFFDWLTDPKWNPSFLVFRDRLADQIACKDGVSRDEAVKTVKYAFGLYMMPPKRSWFQRLAPDFKLRLSSMLRRKFSIAVICYAITIKTIMFLLWLWITAWRWLTGRLNKLLHYAAFGISRKYRNQMRQVRKASSGKSSDSVGSAG